jgi:hypothetical protein
MFQQHVFISYRHESLEHAQAVRRLGESLRQAKIPVALDQFYLEEHPGGPDLGGWPKWCEDSASQSACVLIIASEGWFAAYEKTGPRGLGLGAGTEADVFRQELWDEQGNNARIRVAFLHNVPAQLPVRLRAWHQFRPFDSNDQLDQLIRWVSNCLRLQNIGQPKMRWPEPKKFAPDLADRVQEEWAAIVDLLAGRSRERIVLYQGASGLGKSVLLRQAAIYAKSLKLPVVYVDFNGGGSDTTAILGQFQLDLGDQLPNFCRESANKIHLLRGDMRALTRPALIVFDTYERCASNTAVADWLNQQIFGEIEAAPGLAVIVAGQQIPDYRNAAWRDLARYVPLKPITEVECWKPWVEGHYPGLEKKAHLPTLVLAAQGNPGNMSGLCEAISKS